MFTKQGETYTDLVSQGRANPVLLPQLRDKIREMVGRYHRCGKPVEKCCFCEWVLGHTLNSFQMDTGNCNRIPMATAIEKSALETVPA